MHDMIKQIGVSVHLHLAACWFCCSWTWSLYGQLDQLDIQSSECT